MGESAVQERTDAAPEGQQLQPVKANGAAAIGFGMSAHNWLEGFQIARELAKSSLVPQAFQGKPEDIVVAMQLGAEIGLAPMQALQSIAVVNGRPSVFGDGFLAVVKGSPLCVGHQEWWEVDGQRVARVQVADLAKDSTTAVCSFWRRGATEPYVNSFSVGEARRSKLWDKGGNWAAYPQRMLMWRARSWAGRDAFPDVLRGIAMAEEAQDYDVPRVTVDTIPGAGAPADPVRRSEKQTADAVAPPPVSDAAPEPTSARDGADPKPAGAGKTAKAAEKPAGPGKVTKNVALMETAFVGKPTSGEDPYHEIKGVVVENGKPGLGFTWRTHDEQLAKLAESCAGTQKLFTVTWHELPAAEDKKSKSAKVITGLAAAD